MTEYTFVTVKGLIQKIEDRYLITREGAKDYVLRSATSMGINTGAGTITEQEAGRIEDYIHAWRTTQRLRGES